MEKMDFLPPTAPASFSRTRLKRPIRIVVLFEQGVTVTCYITTAGRLHSSWAISLVDGKRGVFERGVPGVEKGWY